MKPPPPRAEPGALPLVSAFYYTGAVGVFVGVLFALWLFRKSSIANQRKA